MMQKYQYAIPAGLIALLGLWVAYVSYTQSPAAAFAFPRLVSAVFVVLAIWTSSKPFARGASKMAASPVPNSSRLCRA